MNKIKSQTVEDFLKSLGSPSPTPGGGSAAALAGAIASCLVEMVANITIGKKKYLGVQGRVKAVSKQASSLSKELLGLADKDAKAFAAVMTAYRTQDKIKIKKALLVAIAVPYEISGLAKKVEALAIEISRMGAKSAYSDARSAIHLAKASDQSAQENIKINRKALAALE